MAPRAPRKRTIEDANSDSHKFLTGYFTDRGIPESPDDDAALLGECLGRAENARETFKRWRAGPDPPKVGDGGSDSGKGEEETGKLSAKEKYARRLVNNRKSADAARVFQEVLRREHTHALREVSQQRDLLQSDVDQLREGLRLLQEENARLAAGTRLSSLSTRDEGCDFADDGGDEDARAAAAKLCMLGSQPAEPETSVEKLRPSFLAPISVPPLPAAGTVAPDALADPARTLLPVESQQSQASQVSVGELMLRRPSTGAPGPTAFSAVALPSSQGEGGYLSLGGARPAPDSLPLEDLADASELFAGSQGVASSQGFASQPRGASQTAA
jgi:hypothetical protein